MNTNKHFSDKSEIPNSKLQKTSLIFMQLGLILALFAVYLALEYKTFKKQYVFVEPKKVTSIEIYVPDNIRIVEPERETPKTKAITKKVIKTKPVLDKIKVVDTNQKVENQLPKDLLLDDDKPKQQQLQISDIPSVEIPDDTPNDFEFVKVEIKPTFIKCKNKKGKSREICFNKMMQKHVNKYFDIDLATNIGLREGKHRIYVQFVINKNGDIVDVHSNATHPRLKKEAEKVVKKLPKMIPGKQRTQNVNVKYNLPINFNVVY
jgi:protein TonB